MDGQHSLEIVFYLDSARIGLLPVGYGWRYEVLLIRIGGGVVVIAVIAVMEKVGTEKMENAVKMVLMLDVTSIDQWS